MEEVQFMARQIMGPAIDIEPHEALLTCVRLTAGEVAYASYKIEQLTEDNVLESPKTVEETTGLSGENMVDLTKQKTGPVMLNIWIQARQKAVDSLAKYSKMALDAGVAERAVRLAEMHGDQLAMALGGILSELNLSEEDQKRLPMLVQKHLEQLEGRQTLETLVA